MRRKGNAVDGVLLLDKPGGITSNGALQAARRMLNAAKAGHTGTLDPLATGLLPLCFGEATKFSGLLLSATKTYLARIAFGITTTTGDADGEVLSRTDTCSLERDEVVSVLDALVGTHEQVPPMYSALKHEGRPLYEYARAGQEVDRRPRTVHILAIEVLAADATHAEVRAVVSKGTYIRSLAEEAGRRLGCGAHLCALRRESVAGFHVGTATTLDLLGEFTPEERLERLLPADALLQEMPRIDLDERASQAIRQGRQVGISGAPPGLVRLYAGPGAFIGVGNVDVAGVLAPQRLVHSR